MDDRTIRALLDRRARLQAEIRAIDEEVERRKIALLRSMGLSPAEARVTVDKMFTAAARVRVSASKAGGDDLIAKANEAGLTLRGLAERLGVSVSALSLARNGARSIRRQLADKIERATGFRATAANWPGGIVDK